MRFRLSRLLLPMLAAVFALPLGAAGQQGGPFVDPALKLLLSPSTRAAAPGGRFDVLPTDAPLPMAGLLAVDRDTRGRPRVGLLVEVSARAAIDALKARGAQIGTVVQTADGRWLLTARAPLDAADSLTQVRGLVSVYAARRVKVGNDSGVLAIHADDVRQRSGGVWTGSVGKGVIVGIYDTGIDFRHGDFLDAAGQTRLLGLWDQTGSGTPPAGYSYGNYCTQATIQAAIAGNGACSTVDTNGHGTHVAGSAAGNGNGAGTGTAYQYAGVAPGADLLVVKGGNGSFAFDRIIDGLAWISSQAQALGKPAVVNLSLGGQSGPHDGSSIAEQMIDALARPGFAVVVAAGNDGANGSALTPRPSFLLHAGQTISTGETQSYTIQIPQYVPNGSRCDDIQEVELWYPGQDQLDVTVQRPDGTTATEPFGGTGLSDAPGGGVYISNAVGGRTESNGKYVADISFNDCGTSGATPAAGTWTIQITARSATSGQMYHMWMTGADLGGQSGTAGSGFDNRYIVGTPGTAHSVITVAAFTSRVAWRSASGGYAYSDRTALGDLANFSSGGPAADGRQKPDIAAPGSPIVSTLSRDAQNVPGALITTDGTHWALEGTSMATPHVTGAVALMFQAAPTLTSDQIKSIFSTTATQDDFTAKTYAAGGAARDWWGGGKLNVKAALAALNLNPGAIAGVTIIPRVDTLPRNATEKLSAIVYNGIGTPLDSVVTWSSTNPGVATVDGAGLLRAVGLGSAYVIAQAGTARDSAAVVVVAPSVLAVSATNASPSHATVSVKLTPLPLLAVSLRVTGYEGMQVTSLAFDVAGNDPGARLLLFRDADGSGTLGTGDPLLATASAALSGGQPKRIAIAIDSLRIPANGTAQVLMAVEMSGQAPNGSAFTAALAPSETHTLGIRSSAADQLGPPGSTVPSTPALTTVLGANELFALSENPVRSGHVVFNFSKAPTVAAVYTLTGRRVIDLRSRLDGTLRVDWGLTNEDGSAVAPGIYLVVFEVDGTIVRRKLFIASSASTPGAGQE